MSETTLVCSDNIPRRSEAPPLLCSRWPLVNPVSTCSQQLAGREVKDLLSSSEVPPFFLCLFSRARLTSPSSPCERRWPRRAPRLWSAGRPRSLGTPRWSEPAAPRCSSAGLPAHKSRRSDLQRGTQMLSEDSGTGREAAVILSHGITCFDSCNFRIVWIRPFSWQTQAKEKKSCLFLKKNN